jgi:hypothetical protein
MIRRCFFLVIVFVFLYAGVAFAQHPLMNRIANRVIQKYQNSSCQQLRQERAQRQGKPKTMREEEFIKVLRSDPQLRAAFLNRVAAPIANKMFECGMIP